jgi:hypothetical protein
MKRAVVESEEISPVLPGKEVIMANSVYKVIELVGTSTSSWEAAANTAIELASQSLKDLRIAEVVEMDMQIDNGKIISYRTKVRLSLRYNPSIA